MRFLFTANNKLSWKFIQVCVTMKYYGTKEDYIFLSPQQTIANACPVTREKGGGGISFPTLVEGYIRGLWSIHVDPLALSSVRLLKYVL